MTAQRASRRGAGIRVLGWLLPLLPVALSAQAISPVDTLTRDELTRTGRSGLGQMLQALVPGLNAPRPSGAGGTDHLRPVTLRGLGTDQFLVLVNGKRRGESALVNVNGSIGRGQGMVDLNAIPVSAIERVEIHREGQDARSGFGAVAGIIDIILRAGGPSELSTLLGLTTAGDGSVLQAGGSQQIRWGGRDGFLQLSAELARRGATNRARPDLRPQYFPGDPRNDDPALSNRVTQRFGDPESRELAGVLNAGMRLRDKLEGYGFANLSLRRSEAGELWRRPSDDRTVRTLYPNGFLPLIVPRLSDGSLTGGLRGRALGWNWDASLGYGRNSIRYQLEHTANASLGTRSPTSFAAGRLRADLFSAGIALDRRVRGVAILLGGEHHSEGYQIEAGEPDSYRSGAVPIQDGPRAGQPAEPGAQGFPAFRPADTVLERRSRIAGYGELATRIRDRLWLAAAGRIEYYRSLGAIGVYRFSGALEPIRGISVHAAYGTGVRVPSLAQSWFSSRSATITGPFRFDHRTVPVSDPLAVVLGVRRLRSEHSHSVSAGAAWTGVPRLTLSADYYRIAVDDRIILSGSFGHIAVQNFLGQHGYPGIGSVRFFQNALATRTSGLDAAATYRLTLREAELRLRGALNLNRTRVRLTDSIPGLLGLFTDTFFDRVERARLERGQPRATLMLAAVAVRGRWSAGVRAQRFGSVSSFGKPADGSLDQRYAAKWLADLSVSHHRGRMSVLLGAENLFNTYPDRNQFGDANSEGNSNFGVFPYNNHSPFGFAGRFLYLRVSRY
ncbi:MAG TPA: TonB-dependent receptor [Gemmatimonadales bacterium]|nr:TonB-dependent receptor [Gemmatimonadales bacterium]